MAERCPEPQPDCPHLISGNCHISEHHLFWPKSVYKTIIENAFRDLDENKEMLPRCEHDVRHIEDTPPEKPTEAHMIDAINMSGMYISRSLRKTIEEKKR